MLLLYLIYLAFSSAHSYVYNVSVEEINGVLETFPSAVLFYMEGDQLSEQIVKSFANASSYLEPFGVLFGKFNCLEKPDICKAVQVRDLPDLKFFRFELISIITIFRSFLDKILLSTLC